MFSSFLFLKFLEVSVILIPKNRCFSKFGEIIESITSSYSLDGYLLSFFQKLKHLLHISKWSAHSQSYTKNITWILCFILDNSFSENNRNITTPYIKCSISDWLRLKNHKYFGIANFIIPWHIFKFLF